MNHNTVPAWDDRDELLRALSGDWQSFAQPLSQLESQQLADYVCGGLLEYRFEVEVTVIDDPRRVLRIRVVVSGDFAHHLVPFVKRTINDRLPPGTAEKTRRRSWDLRRTARGEWFVEDGFPMAELTLQPPALRVSDARWEERVEQASGDAGGENHVAGHGNPDVVEYQGGSGTARAGNMRAAPMEALITPITLEYFTQRTLTGKSGLEPQWWPEMVAKELLDNAIDAAESAGVAPDVKLVVRSEYIAVEDNGGGIAPEVLVGAFNFTVRASTKAERISSTIMRAADAAMEGEL